MPSEATATPEPTFLPSRWHGLNIYINQLRGNKNTLFLTKELTIPDGRQYAKYVIVMLRKIRGSVDSHVDTFEFIQNKQILNVQPINARKKRYHNKYI